MYILIGATQHQYISSRAEPQDAIEIMHTYSQHSIKAVSFLVCANYIIALFLFIFLWRKGGKR